MTDRQTDVTDIIIGPNKIRAHICSSMFQSCCTTYRFQLIAHAHSTVHCQPTISDYLSSDVTKE